jgi:hypothetical protein
MADDPSWCPAVQTCVTPSADTIQQLNATGVAEAWGSLVEIGATPLTANAVITLPASAGNAGKTITFKRLDNTAFTVTLNPAVGDTGEVTTPTALNSQFGALTVEVASATKYEQVSNISAAVAATTNTLVATGAAITSTVDGVAATITPAVGVIQDVVGFNAAGALVKAVPAAGSILALDSTQTANRVQNLGGFSQTWNNVGDFTKNVVSGIETANYTDAFTPANATLWSTFDGFNYSTNNGIGDSGALYVQPTGGAIEFANANGSTRLGVGTGTVGAAAGSPQTFVKTAAVSDTTATVGQVLTLTNATTGEAEYATLPSAIDTIQTAGSTGQTNVAAWGSVVLIPTLTGNITLTYPIPAFGVGKTIKVVKVGTPNAFTISHNTGSGAITFTNAAGELASTAGAITLEAVDTTNIRQVSNSVAEATVSALTYGRVHAVADLPATSFTIASPGTKIPFSATVYNSGMAFSGTDSIVPSQAGRYRVSWFMLSGSGDMQADGTFHVVQNGVSLGNIFVDMMQAAGVNQVSNFLDLNLAAGQAVELRYQPATADTIPWGRGSYFDIAQLPTAVAPVIDTVAEFAGPNYATSTVDTTSGTSSSATALQFMSLAIPSAGTWSIEWSVLALIWNGNSASSNGSLMSGLYDGSGVFIVNSELSSGGGVIGSATASNFNVQGTRSIIVTTTRAETYNVKVWDPTITGRADAGSSALGRSYMLATKIAGQLPATGSTVDYAYARLSTNTSVANAATDVVLNANLQGNIPNAAGVFTLTAGKTYSLSANFLGLSFDQATTQGTIRFVDSTNTQVSGSPSIVLRPSTDTSLNGTTPGFEFVFTPPATGDYKFRADAAGVGRSFQIGQSESSVSIHQLGSSLNTVGTLLAADNSAAGYFDIGNMRIQWGLHDDGNVDTTTVTLPAPFLNNTFVVTATSNSGTAGSVAVELKTTTTFDLDRASTTVNANIWGWQAIGLKP